MFNNLVETTPRFIEVIQKNEIFPAPVPRFPSGKPERGNEENRPCLGHHNELWCCLNEHRIIYSNKFFVNGRLRKHPVSLDNRGLHFPGWYLLKLLFFKNRDHSSTWL